MNITVDDVWQDATTEGVDLLQESLGETETGTLTLGQIVFLPGDQLVTTVDGTLGSTGADRARAPRSDPPGPEFVNYVVPRYVRTASDTRSRTRSRRRQTCPSTNNDHDADHDLGHDDHGTTQPTTSARTRQRPPRTASTSKTGVRQAGADRGPARAAQGRDRAAEERARLLAGRQRRRQCGSGGVALGLAAARARLAQALAGRAAVRARAAGPARAPGPARAAVARPRSCRRPPPSSW